MRLIIGFTTFVFFSLLIRLADVQLINGKSFESLAENNKTYVISSSEERGIFFDRYDQPLVYNKPVYYKLDSSETLYSEKSRINHQEALEIMSQDSDLIRTDLERMYLYPKSLAHILGYVGSVSSDDLINDNSLEISDKVGKFGLEKEYQNLLRGTKSLKYFEINALGEKQHLISESEGIPGKNLPTTIDPYLSQVALEAMGDNKGAVVILDASNAEILALVSNPSFDSSVISESFADEELERKRMIDIQGFFSNPQQLFFNRAISGAYPPGSVFKLITALAGLEGKKIDQGTSVLDEGVLKVGDYSYANWYFTQYGGKEGEISLLRAIARSNDIYFYKVAEWVGPEKLKEMASLFSLGEKTGVELQAEVEGFVPDPEWKQREIGERWFLGNTYHMGIGQGDILVTPIQIAQMIQAIANNGTLCKATLIDDKANLGDMFQKNRCKEVGVLEENINLVFEGMLEACSAGGTGFPFFEYNSGVFKEGLNVEDQIHNGAVACKTGTSEFGMPDDRGYRKTHAWFASVMGTKTIVKNAIEARIKDDSQQVESSQEAELVEDLNGVQLSDNEQPEGDIQTEGDVQPVADRQNTSIRDLWLDAVEKKGFPDEIVVVVLVESDEVNPYKEGSADAGPVSKKILDWMIGKDVNLDVGQASEVNPTTE